MLLYVEGSTGFKAGGFNGRPSPTTGLAPFAPERLRSIETGIKSDRSETGAACQRGGVLQQLH